MSKKDDILRGGLNTLFNGAPKDEAIQEQGEPQPVEAETITPTDGEEQEQEIKSNDVINTIEDEELRAALHKRRVKGRGRPRKNDPKKQCAKGYQRITNIVNIDKMDKLREIALRESLTIKEILEAVMDIAIERYESRHGEIKIRQIRAADLFREPNEPQKK